MQAVWSSGVATTRDVHQQLLRRRSIAYTTVMTVMGILTRKGLLERSVQGRAYVYQPTLTQEELTRSHVAKVLGGLLERFSGPAMTYLISKLAAVDEAKLAELEAEVSRLRQQRATRHPPSGDTRP
ncbi:MAG: BlaI/MecI/CopY family transcriptional regulator [Chloroflexi bacterium]|nr:BlaI/MecI/CopY family transcriptional regulator [Chloroflexota bacterium]